MIYVFPLLRYIFSMRTCLRQTPSKAEKTNTQSNFRFRPVMTTISSTKTPLPRGVIPTLSFTGTQSSALHGKESYAISIYFFLHPFLILQVCPNVMYPCVGAGHTAFARETTTQAHLVEPKRRLTSETRMGLP